MKFSCPLICVSDMARSKEFYARVLGLDVVSDFGANVTLTGGISLQTEETWKLLTGRDAVTDSAWGELYFEEDHMDAFLSRLDKMEGVSYVHPPLEHPWGQRAVRIYDPDRHIIEIGETLLTVIRRFMAQGMDAEAAAMRMDVPEGFIRALLSENGAQDGV